MKLRHIIKSNHGIGILQVLVVMSFLFLMVYGILTILTNSRIEQKKQNTLASLREVQVYLTELLNNQESWRKTLNEPSNVSMACLRDKTNCSTAQNEIVTIKDANNNSYFANLPTVSTVSPNYGGFTEDGAFCSTFVKPPGAGNDACPFSYLIIWEPVTTGVSDPGIRISARLLYNPAPNTNRRIPIRLGQMNYDLANDFSNLNTVDNSTKKAVNVLTDANNQVLDVKLGKYDVVVWRTAFTNVQSFQVTANSDSTGPCSGGNRTGLTESYDPFNLITVVGGTNIVLRSSGTYECDVIMNGYSTKGFKGSLTLTSTAAIVGSGSSFADTNVQATLDFNTSFRVLNDGDSLTLQQSCELTGGATGLGIQPSSPPASIITSLTCRLIE